MQNTSLEAFPIIAEAVPRLAGVVRRTPLERIELAGLDARIELRLKLECLQETRSFKARGAWNQIVQLDPAERAAGVVTTSSGNHGQALAWAAQRAGVRATIVMPEDAYPNKIAACRAFGAEVVLAATRAQAEGLCALRVAQGAVLVHPYDAARTIQGAGTVGLEIAEDWPEVEVCVSPAGGGGLVAGTSLGLRQALGQSVRIFAVEPLGAPTLGLGLQAGEPVVLEALSSQIQGLCPPYAGRLNIAICALTLDGVVQLDDEDVFRAQAALVRALGQAVEPAGAAATAFVLGSQFPAELLEGRSPADPLRVAAIVSGGNPDPAQLASIS